MNQLILIFGTLVLIGCGGNTGSVTQHSVGALNLVVEMDAVSAKASFDSLENGCTSNLAASAAYSVIGPGGTISGTGNFFHRADSVAAISNGFGNVYLFGTGASSHVNSITAFTGNVYLCNMSLGAIDGVANGNIFVDGPVGSISNSQGNIFLYAEDFPPVAKFFGNVIIKTSGGQYRGRSYSVQ